MTEYARVQLLETGGPKQLLLDEDVVSLDDRHLDIEGRLWDSGE